MKVVARRKRSEAERIYGYAHDVEIEGGHTIRVDEPTAAGGTDTGPSPTRLVAAGLASCVAITMEMYADRKGWDIGPVEVDVDVTYRDYAPISFALTLRLPGDLSDEQRERLLVVAAKCPVHRLVAGETEVVISDEIEAL
jgi:putative redox protein